MSKIKHLIHKVASATGGKRNSLKSTVSNEAAPEVAAHRNVVGFAKTNREVHPPPQGGTNHHGRRRNRSLSLTEEKALRCEAREAAEEREKQRHDAEKQKAYDEDPLKDNYGDRPFTNQKSERKSERINNLSREDAGRQIIFKARVHHARAMSKHVLFLVFRQNIGTIQGVLTEGETMSQNMLLWAESLHNESIVWVEGTLQIPQNDQREVKSPSVHDVEIKIEKLYLVASPTTVLPFQVEDVSCPITEPDNPGSQHVKVGQTTRLNNRTLDLRAPASQSIFRIHSGVTKLFREFLDNEGFTEIQSPKLQPSATESGAAVFKVDYFRRPAYLAQSPQLAKQMCIASDMGRVYEIGPVFRAENSNTHRHLTEYTGLDLEMEIDNHYHEVMNTLDKLFLHMFRGLYRDFRDEIDTVKLRYPHEDLLFLDETLCLPYAEGIQLLADSGWIEEDGSQPDPNKDLSTKGEQVLGRLIREEYHTDYYILDKMPTKERPFYTMPDDENPEVSNSFDFFIRGEEVLSGGQRIHCPQLLAKRLEENGIDPTSMTDYVNGFRWGCPPHGGGGIGLERVVMLVLKLGDVRWASLFPRDPKSFPHGDDLAEASMAAAASLILHGPESKTRQALGVTGQMPPLKNLIAAYGDATNTSWLDPFWTVWRDPKTGGAVGYVEENKFAITFGTPLCDPKHMSRVVRSYLHYIQDEKKLRPIWACVDNVCERVLAHELGWSAVSAIAEERFNPTEVEPEKNDKTVRRKVRRAERDGVKVVEVDGEVDEHTRELINKRLADWETHRKGAQVHLTGLRPFDDSKHRKYFYAKDSNGTICALVVLAQLAPAHGFQIKWALDFPGAPLGTIEYILTHVIKKLGEVGVRSATFGAGSTGKLQRVDNVGGFRIMALEKTYNGLTHAFPSFSNKSDFRTKFGVHPEPLYICFPKGGMGMKGIEALMTALQRPK